MTKIKVSQNGPYLISGKLPLNEDIIEYDQEGYPEKTKKGKSFPIKGEYALCRCGHSTNKPFCTGAHQSVNFDGTENPDAKQKYEDVADVINGPDLTLKDAGKFCVGAGFCHRATGVWNLTQNSDDPQAKKIATTEACCCPSGRLVACDKKNWKSH